MGQLMGGLRKNTRKESILDSFFHTDSRPIKLNTSLTGITFDIHKPSVPLAVHYSSCHVGVPSYTHVGVPKFQNPLVFQSLFGSFS